MIGHDSYLATLNDLPPAAREQEIRQKVTDSLQGLVACVEQSLPIKPETPHSCVIDDVQVLKMDPGPDGCRLLLAYTASARLYNKGRGDLERITGKADALLDDAGQVTYRGATYDSERDFVAPDIGGGD